MAKARGSMILGTAAYTKKPPMKILARSPSHGSVVSISSVNYEEVVVQTARQLGVIHNRVGCMMDDYSGSGAETGFLAAMLGAYFVFVIGAYLVYGLCIGKVLQKAGKPLWAGFVPIYNFMLLLEIVGRPAWWVILLFIPFVNAIVGIIASIDLAKSFGKDTVFGVLLVIVSIIMWPILAFGDATYQGPSVTQG